MTIFACTVIVCVVLSNMFVICMTCGDGYFFDENRKCVPCPEHCMFCDSLTKCLSCESGYWGNVCEAQCSKCKNGTSCEKTNGFCLEACQDGRSGILCDYSCDSKCFSCNRTNILNCVKCAFGRYPSLSCENFCSTCNDTTCGDDGNCIFGCVKGFWGKTCNRVCPEHCLNEICDWNNGNCINGCKNNYSGLNCDEVQISVVLITILAIIVMIITVIVVVAIKRRKRLKKLVCRRSENYISQKSDAPENMKMINREPANATTSECVNRSEDLEVINKKEIVHAPKTGSANQRSGKSKLKSNSLVCCVIREREEGQNDRPKLGKKMFTKDTKKYEIISERQHKLHTLAKSIKQKKETDYQSEWEKIPIPISTLSNECRAEPPPGSFERQGIGPYEFNKVSVKGATRLYYFNASYIVQQERNEPTYIACIGPNAEYKKCFALFWRMVMETNCHTIVMLNAVKKEKDEQYWPPRNQKQFYSQINVKLTEEREGESYALRRFHIKEEGTEARHVTQIQYNAWPEMERASNMESFLEFFKIVHIETSKTCGPIIVHGRAGVGRTGTFIALDMLRREAEDLLDSVDKMDEKRVNIRVCVKHLRTQRVNMVETIEQYKFLHEAFAQVIFNMLEEKGYQKEDETPV